MIDTDASGAIDAPELYEALKNRKYNLSREFSDFVVNILKQRNPRGITFDLYCRVAARFDYLCESYTNIKFYQRQPLERYLKETFFTEFW